MKICTKCNVEKDISEYFKGDRYADGYQNWCKTCYRNYSNERSKDPKVKEKKRSEGLKRKFNLTLEEYDRIFDSQNGKCSICGSSNSGRTGNFCIDHNHKTGKVRGLLCHNCNLMIGNSGDSIYILLNGIKYLEKDSIFIKKGVFV